MNYQDLINQLASAPYGTTMDYNGQRGTVSHDGTALILPGGQSVPLTKGPDGSIQFGQAYNNDPGFDTADFIKNGAIAVGGAYGLGTLLSGMAAGGAAAAAPSWTSGYDLPMGATGADTAVSGGISGASPTMGGGVGVAASTPSWMTTPTLPDIPVDPSAGAGMDFSSLASNPKLWAAGAGALIGSQQPSSLTSTSSSGLPSYAMPYAMDYLQRATDFSKTPGEQYGGTLGANTTADQNASYGLARNIGLSAGNNPLNTASSSAFMDTLSGKYLNPATNPMLQQTYDAAASRMADNYARGTAATNNAFFGGSGSFGGSAHQEMTAANNKAFGDSLANLGTQIYGQNYANERNNMVNAMNNAPSVAGNILGQQIQGFNTLNNAGSQQQQTALTNNNLAYQDFLRLQQDKYNKLGAAQSAFQGLGQNTTQTTPGTTMTNGLLGGALTGAGIYKLLG